LNIDYLIVGQGLAGSLLAWELIQRGQRVVIIDSGQLNASQVAAGLINPVTGMRLVKTDQVERLLPVAKAYYSNLSHFFKQDFYIEKPLYRLLQHPKDWQAAQKRLQQADYKPYLAGIVNNHSPTLLAKSLLKQRQTGYLLTSASLTQLKQFFTEKGVLLTGQLDYASIKLFPHLNWNQLFPRQIIFCEGYQAVNNPWFSSLPFQLVKGEIITAYSEGPLAQTILNYGHWLIPLDEHQFRTGATFDRTHLDRQVTTNAQQLLLDSLYRICPQFSIRNIIYQQAGIRPATEDKQPFIGVHPLYPQLLIFNGFGAKGSLQIPQYCLDLVDYLLHQQPLPKHCCVSRYYQRLTK